MRVFILILLVVCMAAPALAQDKAVTDEPKAETITIHDRTYTVVPDEVFRAMGFVLPEVPPEENAATYYLQVIEAYAGLEHRSQANKLRDAVLRDCWTEESGPLAKYLEENEKPLALIEQAGAKAVCHFPFLVDEGKSLEDVSVAGILLPHLSVIRELARFLVTEGKAREFEGRYADALDAYLLIPRLGDHVAQDPILINGLVGIACNAIGMKAIEQCLARYEIDEETLARVQKRVHELAEHRPRVAVAMRGEQVFSMEMTEYFIRHPARIWKLWGGKPEPREIIFALLLQTERGKAQVRREMREFWRLMDELLALPLHEYITKEDEFRARVHAKTSRMSTVRMLVPALWGARVQYGRDELCWTVLDVEFALARYAAEHGMYPETLDGLEGLMLSAGVDPYSDEPLNYRLEPDGSFTIWSVGGNLEDDGGDVGKRHNPWRGDDHVWNSGLLCGAD